MERIRLGIVRLRCCASLLQPQVIPKSQVHVGRPAIHTSCIQRGLEEFFDSQDNIEAGKRTVGRPWRKDELRIKSNEDLHKLWYVLLKERNMVMTEEHMHAQKNIYFPNPERVDKVEESMENLLEVVGERDEAYRLLEKGDDKTKKPYAARNMVGIPYFRNPTEHYVPKHMNRHFRRTHPQYEKWMGSYLRRYEERLRLQYDFRNAMYRKKKEEMMKEFPHLTEEDLEHLKPHMRRLDRFLEASSELGDYVNKAA